MGLVIAPNSPHTPTNDAMELYATGFNAWNQLRVADPLTGWDDEPDDMFRFTCVFADEAIRDVRPALTYTRGKPPPPSPTPRGPEDRPDGSS